MSDQEYYALEILSDIKNSEWILFVCRDQLNFEKKLHRQVLAASSPVGEIYAWSRDHPRCVDYPPARSDR